MPNFKYDCDNCQEQFTIQQSFKEKGAAVCPKCHQTTTKYVFGGGAFRVIEKEWSEPRDVPIRKRL